MRGIDIHRLSKLPLPDTVSSRSFEDSGSRPSVQGKFLYRSGEKLWVRGVTYGTFRPNIDGDLYPRPDVVEGDFAAMADHGFNAVRTYTAPPIWLLDLASQHGLCVQVGFPWEQHVTFLDDKPRVRSIEQRVRDGVREVARHPAILGYSIGNEIPAPIVRWYGHRRIERFIKRLYDIAKTEDPAGLVTYVNYPSTEYLCLPFLDLLCFNVYLESPDQLQSYLARLQNLAGERPLLMGEMGLDSRHHSEAAQADSLDGQVRTAFSMGCAGAFVFAWTDEWYRGGYDVEDWDFGLTRRTREPKPALAVVQQAFIDIPVANTIAWPDISVVVCSYNGSRTIRDTFESLAHLDYPAFEVIVVDDGSTDATADIAREYGFQLISTEHQGLSHARNVGVQAARGEIVAYLDDDAYADPHWLTYLALTFLHTDHVGVGGPNLPPPHDGPLAACVANAPGCPTHVLLSDREAEHIPGCNMAFRKTALQSIDGFDPQFQTAGDDVDVCWRLRQRGWTLGFHPAAVVWHHRRNSIRAYWQQQYGYGRAEALLEQKWPEKFNETGNLVWRGHLYDTGRMKAFIRGQPRIYQGIWGSALFQSMYQPALSSFNRFCFAPGWYLTIVMLMMLSGLSLLWSPLQWALPLLVVAVGVVGIPAIHGSMQALFDPERHASTERLNLYVTTAFLHLVQPIARLCGRLQGRLPSWHSYGVGQIGWPWPRTISLWSEQWQDAVTRLKGFEAALHAEGVRAKRGGAYDRWDLDVSGGFLGAARLLMTIEEHGAGKQLVRFRIGPKP
ncbi:MAG: glycosyltransferase, partial [Candidatus Tectomicrobia bacterium]|nr:glycosyltransferase [Candidatus Tectomicrobia bacterium]